MSFGARDLIISVLPVRCPGPTGCNGESACPAPTACPAESGCAQPSLCPPPSDCGPESPGHPTAWCTTTQENDRRDAAGLEALRRQLIRALATG